MDGKQKFIITGIIEKGFGNKNLASCTRYRYLNNDQSFLKKLPDGFDNASTVTFPEDPDE